MSMLGRFAKLDSALQRGLDNSFALVFGGRVVPAEIDELLKQEAEDNIFHNEDDLFEAPNVYSVSVSEKDFHNLSELNPELPESFADQMSRYCRNHGWVLVGPVVVTISADSGMRTGQLKASSTSSPQPASQSGFDKTELDKTELDKIDSPDSGSDEPPTSDENLAGRRGEGHQGNTPQVSAPPAFPGAAVGSAFPVSPGTVGPSVGTGAGQSPEESESMSFSGNQEARSNANTEHMEAQSAGVNPATSAGPGPKVSLLLQDGSSRTYLVHEGSNILGRSNDVDFRLPDTGVSRQHAEVTWDGRDAVLVDLQSTNGTTVNDTPVENWLLADGDVITMGHSHIEVRITGL
ncbi:FhaA domain-containing protein [Corynebacterium sp. A21]|uniref:FhaA domain-containing protein n=1 Tax=Corynebacterium sp. A21 TaxID=3457318 RepID=UPI003FD3801B